MIDMIDMKDMKDIKDIKNNIDESNLSQSYPITGSAVYDSNDKLLGIVSYVNSTEIIITPLICIGKMGDYLKGENLLYLGCDFFPIKLNFKSRLDNINYSNGLLIINNFYDNIIGQKKKLEKKIAKLQNDNNLKNPENLENLENFENLENHENHENNPIINNLIKQYNLIKMIETDKNLKKGNIICSIDNYKINSEGLIIINENSEQKIKTIPFKSYIWLFKNSFNNRLVLNNILPNNYIGNLTKLISTNDEIIIDDTYIKKKINLNQSNIILKSQFNTISSFRYNELKHIKYNSINLIELDEIILGIIKNYIGNSQSIYSSLIENIFNNKYTYKNEKILLIFNFQKKIPTIKIVSKRIKNFEDLLNTYKTKKDLKKFLIQM